MTPRCPVYIDRLPCCRCTKRAGHVGGRLVNLDPKHCSHHIRIIPRVVAAQLAWIRAAERYVGAN